MRPFWHLVLGGLLVASLLWSGWSLWQLSRLPLGAWVIERSAHELGAAYDRVLARRATPEAIAARVEERLEDAPRNWVALEGLWTLAEAQAVDLPEATRVAYQLAHAADHGSLRRAQDCIACAYDLRTCAMGAALGCGVVVNMTALGDLLSLGRAAGVWVQGGEVDQLDVTLSFIGIGATGLVVVTGGTSYAVKSGAGLMKVAHRMGRMTPGVRSTYRRGFRDGVDWARVPAIRRADDLAQVARPEALRPAVELTGSLGAMQARLGSRGALYMMGQVETVADARRMARATEALGTRSVGTLELLGKSRFLRVGLRLADALREMIAAFLGALSVILGLTWSRLLRGLRRLAWVPNG
ncbi:MAG: hypothetical protein EA407_02265 [Rhodobacteraceae bacterium]|nr:MAG: hypothetical protein EA407_02265 [Paracoccaceae bacterium]